MKLITGVVIAVAATLSFKTCDSSAESMSTIKELALRSTHCTDQLPLYKMRCQTETLQPIFVECHSDLIARQEYWGPKGSIRASKECGKMVFLNEAEKLACEEFALKEWQTCALPRRSLEELLDEELRREIEQRLEENKEEAENEQ